VSILTLVNASGERKTPQMRSHKLHRMFAEVRPNFGRIVTCCQAEHSAEFFCRTSASAELRPISIKDNTW